MRMRFPPGRGIDNYPQIWKERIQVNTTNTKFTVVNVINAVPLKHSAKESMKPRIT